MRNVDIVGKGVMSEIEHKGSAAITPKYRHSASFGYRNKIARILWILVWGLLCRMTPPQFHRWRRLVLIVFGARIERGAKIYQNCRIWLPKNLKVGEDSVVGRYVNIYNQGMITIGSHVVISQNVTLCASTHDINDQLFPLVLRPIAIGDHVWIAAEAFVGPGVNVGDGAVLGARGVAMRDLENWVFYSGNPAERIKARRPMLSQKAKSDQSGIRREASI